MLLTHVLNMNMSIIHKKICDNGLNCRVNLVKNSSISSELLSTILKKAAVFEKENKNKKQKK